MWPAGRRHAGVSVSGRVHRKPHHWSGYTQPTPLSHVDAVSMDEPPAASAAGHAVVLGLSRRAPGLRDNPAVAGGEAHPRILATRRVSEAAYSNSSVSRPCALT